MHDFPLLKDYFSLLKYIHYPGVPIFSAAVTLLSVHWDAIFKVKVLVK